MKITDVLDQLGQDVLSADTKKMLAESFSEAVNTAVNEKVTIEVETQLKKLDEDHATKLEKLLESIDEDHTKKLQAVLEKIDQDHTEKLKVVIENYKRVLATDAKVFQEELVEKISNYLDLYIGEKIPKDEITEAVKNVKARNIVDKIKEIVALDEQYVNETITEAVKDGKQTIDALRGELNEAVKANIKLNQEKKATETRLMLETKTAGLSKDKKTFVLRVLGDKDPEIIEENFDYVVKMFEKEEDDKKQLLSEDAKKGSKIVSGKVDTPQSVVKEPLTSEVTDDSVSGYLSELKTQDDPYGVRK